MEEDLKVYRNQLLETEQKVGEIFSKNLITLSSGAIAVSFVFIKNIVGKGPIVSSQFLTVSWGLFVISLLSVLLGQYFGILSYRKAINQVDSGKIYEEFPGGIWSKLISILNFSSTTCFISGIICMLIFGYKNLGG